MRTRPVLACLASSIFLFLSCTAADRAPLGCGRASEDFGRPNVWLITIDALRPDHLGVYGYQRPTSPNLDAFAKKGAVFEQAVTQASYTVPSVATVLTGELPLFHGEKHNPVPLPRDNLTLARLLSSKGYRTAAFVDNGILTNLSGWDQGFETYSCIDADEARAVSAQVNSWLDRLPGEPFFLWTHFLDPHAPYKDRETYREFFAEPSDTRDWIMSAEVDDESVQWNEAETRNAVNLYDGEIRYLDGVLGALFQRLETSGLLSRTAVVLTADHGEAFMEHGHKSHGYGVYEEEIRVPLIFVFPRDPQPGRRISPMVRLMDLFPTIARFAGVEPGKVQGQSLIPLLMNRSGWKERVALTQASSGDFSVRTGASKLIRLFKGGKYVWFDLERDPHETNPASLDSVPGGDAKEALRMRGILDGYMRLWQYSKPEIPSKLDPQTLEALKALGYVR